MFQLESAQAALLDWFGSNQEDLPWRNGRDPYRVWLSETMLQQTQVDTVIPYFERFLRELPDIPSLASAPLDRVLKLWEGLGYYSRARNLHHAAQIVVEQYGGRLPSAVDELVKLPGIGRYTAGAIASLAFDVDAPVLDGNVIRVLARLFDFQEDVSSDSARRTLWRIAGDILPAGRAGPWNEGLMELGRRVCTPKKPSCQICPLREYCQARLAGAQEHRPVKTPRKAIPHVEVAAAIIRADDGRVLIARRPEDKMLGGLWEFPGGKREPGETFAGCLQREIAEELGIEIEVGSQFAVIRHAFTHFKMTMVVFLCRHISGSPQAIGCTAWAWVTPKEFDQYAFPVTDLKVIRALRDGSQLGLFAE